MLLTNLLAEDQMIRKCWQNDLQTMYAIINDAAQAYKGVIPKDRWQDPYMPLDELKHEIENGIIFWGIEEGGNLVGIMGIQDKVNVTLIRHAYVLTNMQNRGMGTQLLQHLEGMTKKPVLIGTWETATWAIRFYERNGYCLLSRGETEQLLKTYWNIPERQVETSVVLANSTWEVTNKVSGNDALEIKKRARPKDIAFQDVIKK
ncbi:MAG: GNAT family N-acetyltransferase [Thermodesulfobacteriota bacterium]